MGRSFKQRRVFPQLQAEVHRAVEMAMQEAGLMIEPGATETEIKGSKGMSALSWGENITVNMGTFPGGGTQVLIESRLKFSLGFVDWGKNQANCETLTAALENRLGPGRVEPV